MHAPWRWPGQGRRQGPVSGTADQDQAEQLLLAQGWQLGYGAQPPLYTDLVKLLFLLGGTDNTAETVLVGPLTSDTDGRQRCVGA